MSDTIALRISQYLQLRAKRKAIKEQFEAADKPYAEMENLLSGLILRHLDAIGADNVRTKEGTCYRSERSTATVADKQAFMKHVRESGEWELLDVKANSTATKGFIAANNHEPPGVRLTTMVTLGVRSPAKKAPEDGKQSTIQADTVRSSPDEPHHGALGGAEPPAQP